MAKQIDFGKVAFDKLLNGATKLSNAVSVTLGAKGRNVLLEGIYENDTPHITKDGVTVAKAVQLKDPVERISANLMKKVSLRTNELVGDGTTTSIVLAHAILQYGADAINKEGVNPIMLKRGIDKELTTVLKELDELGTPLNDDMDLAHKVALISANGDDKIATLVTDVYKVIGKDGNVAIEPDMNSPECSFKKVEGLEFDRGYNNPYYVTDIPTESAEYYDPLILISDYRIMNANELKSVIGLVQKLNRPLIVICEEIDPAADNILAVNKIQNGLQIATINTPEFGDRRLNFLEDLAIVTGGKFISNVTGKTFDDVVEEDFGRCEKIYITRDNTAIIGGKGDRKEIAERLESVLNQADNAKNDDHKEYLQKRYAKLKGGVVVIKVGGYSDVERVEIKDRVEDAVNAVKSALVGGIIPGGGVPLLRLSTKHIEREEGEREEEFKGRVALRRALKIPFNTILLNAGITDYSKLYEKLLSLPNNFVYDVSEDEIVDSDEKGIIDPTLVTRTALINSTSVAGTLLSTGCTISFDPDNGDNDLKL